MSESARSVGLRVLGDVGDIKGEISVIMAERRVGS